MQIDTLTTTAYAGHMYTSQYNPQGSYFASYLQANYNVLLYTYLTFPKALPSSKACCCQYETPIKMTKHRADSFPKDEAITPEKLKGSCSHYVDAPSNLHLLPQQSLAGSYARTDGSYDGEMQSQSGEGQKYSELQYKKPRKVFNSKEERLEFVRSYMAKEKTELCKNWEAYGWCKFGDHCSFAHGVHELRARTGVPPTFKTRQCRQYTENLICPYGCRCQFIHNPLTSERQKNASYVKMMQENISYSEARLKCLEDPNVPAEFNENLMYISSYDRRRLNVFSKLGDGFKL